MLFRPVDIINLVEKPAMVSLHLQRRSNGVVPPVPIKFFNVKVGAFMLMWPFRIGKHYFVHITQQIGYRIKVVTKLHRVMIPNYISPLWKI